MNTQGEDSQHRAIVRIAAHLPDLIVYRPFSPELPSVDHFDGVLMFVDISGFTEMTEKFSRAMYMDRGAEQLVEILNYHISAIVEKVLNFGGDILKFAGDALLAIWKVGRERLKGTITVAVKCSLEVHRLLEAQEPKEGLDVRVKIGLAAGHITMLVFGDKTHNHFVMAGQVVEDVRLAQNMAQMNDVILSPNCWQLCDRSMIEIERIPNERAVKVTFLKTPPSFNFDEFFTNCMTFMDYYPSGDHKSLLRLTCKLESDPELELSLQKYLMDSILKQIDDKQLRGYLSELRPVTIVFVNLLFKDQDKAEVIGSAIQEAFVHISSVLRVFRGQINKVFMFDKGCCFLCVFGFPGEKAPDEVTQALESAVDIFTFCSQVPHIHTVSVGVTSGIVFCGIIGHSMRHEYTVIGQTVNTAARMIVYYPGIVTCDSVTYKGSNLPAYSFKELQKKTMRGVADSGPVYQCLGIKREDIFGEPGLTCNRNKHYPLLGRDKEIDHFMRTKKEFLTHNCSRVLVYEGASGCGKSQILAQIECLAQNENHRTITIELTKISFQKNFYTIPMLMVNVLHLHSCKNYGERQTNLQNKVNGLLDKKFYCILNDIFYVQFPVSREVSKMSALRKQNHLEELFMKILKQTVNEERIIFIIDEGQFVDLASWAFLEKLLQTAPVFLVMSLSPFTDALCPAASTVMRSRTTTHIILGAMQPADIGHKVCLDLGVRSIPKELNSYLAEGSCGIPLYCEELLTNLKHDRVLVFQPMESEEEPSMDWNSLLRSFAKPIGEPKTFPVSNDEGSEKVCNLVSGVVLKNLLPPASLKETCLVQLDSMSFSHQMLVRYAAVAAVASLTFTTGLLLEILPCWNMKMMTKALAGLMKSGVFGCFRSSKELRTALEHNEASFEVHHRSSCLKPREGVACREQEELHELESKVIECLVIRFCRPVMQQTAYELWLKDQKRAMHLTCVHFLEENAHRCDRCRSRDFIPFHHFVVDTRLNALDIKEMAKSHRFQTEEETTFSKTQIPKRSEKIFPENLSPEEIREKILNFFDTIIAKMKTPERDLVPLEPCRCEEILETVFRPLAYHFLALGENNKALYYFLEIVSAYLTLGDNYMVYVYLNEGERLLKMLKKENSCSQTFESATLYSFKGQVCFSEGQMVLAEKMLRKALRLLNRIFPCNLISLFLQTHVEKNRHFRYMSQPAHKSLLPGKKRLAQLCQQTACLSLLWQIYSLKDFFNYKHYGHLAAMMQVNTALESQDDFQIVKAYLDYSLHHQLAGYEGVWFKYEVLAVEQLFNLPLKGEGIEIITYAAYTLSYIKFMMGYLDLAIDLGSRAHKLCALLRNPNECYMVLCWLSKSLFLKSRHKQLVQVLGRLWDLSVAEEHILSKAFFYFVCLDIMLYSGFVYRPFEECLDFIKQNEDNRILRLQSGIVLGLYSCVAIWYARLQEWNYFHEFSDTVKNLVPRRTPTALYYEGISRFLEGQVLHLQKKIEEQPSSAQESGAEALKNLESLVAHNTVSPVFYPRLYHLMAYVCTLMGDVQNCDLFLNTALQLSETQGNELEKCWLNISKEGWYTASEFPEDQWNQTLLSLPSWQKIVSGKPAPSGFRSASSNAEPVSSFLEGQKGSAAACFTFSQLHTNWLCLSGCFSFLTCSFQPMQNFIIWKNINTHMVHFETDTFLVNLLN
ncbi:Adenylate cyclase type 10 [Manis javanica]|nr:Adenylate cyclase type 10 [Manis javanica]